MNWFKYANPTNLFQELNALRPEMAMAAQKIYDAWTQDGEMGDPELGFGGICDEVANELSGIIASKVADVEVEDYGFEGDDHASITARRGQEFYVVDIPASVYETGSGYSWTKKPGVTISPNDVYIGKL